MGGALASLGALAGGVAQGLERGQQMTQRQQHIDANTKQQAENDKLKADMAQADAAMAERLKGFETEHSKTQPSAMKNYLTLGGSDSSMPDQTGNDAPVAAASPFRPNEQQLLQAAQARTDKLFQLGRHDVAVKQWAQDEGLRAQMRKKAVAEGMMAFNSTGDLKPLLSNVYRHLDDGHDLSNLAEVNNPDPKAPRAWDIERTNTLTGEKKVDRITQDQIDGLVAFATDPTQASRYSLIQKVKQYAAEQQRQTNSEKHDDRMEEIGLSNDGRIDVAKLAAATREQVAKLNFDGRIRVSEIRGAARGGLSGLGGSGGNVARTVNLADGRVLMIMRNGDQRIASGDDGKPLTSLEYERLVGSTAKTVAKSLGNFGTPEENQARARNMLPKPAAAAPKPRMSLGDLPAAPGSGATDYSTLWK